MGEINQLRKVTLTRFIFHWLLWLFQEFINFIYLTVGQTRRQNQKCIENQTSEWKEKGR